MISEIAAYVAVAIVCVWTIRTPFVGVVAYYVLELARPHDVYWWSLAQSRLSLSVAAVVCAVWLIGWIRKSHGGPGRSPVNALLFIFFLLNAASVPFAADQTAAWDYIQRVSKIILFYFVSVSLINTRARFRWISLAMAASLGYLGLWGNWQWYVEGIGAGVQGELVGPGWEIGAVLTDRNIFGYTLAIGIPICFFVFMTERATWIRWPALGCLPFMANAVMLTFGRAAFLGMLAGSAWSVVRLRRVVLVATCAALGALLMYRLAGPEVVTRMLTIEAYEDDRAATSRIESWKAGFQMILDYPLLGVGPGNYGHYSSIYNPNVPKGLVAHNEFIQTAAETGVPSAFMLLAIMGLAFYNLYRVRKATWFDVHTRWAYYYAAMLESSLLAYLLGAMFVSLWFFEPFYLLIGLTVCLRRIVEREAAEAAGAREVVPDPASHRRWPRPIPVAPKIL